MTRPIVGVDTVGRHPDGRAPRCVDITALRVLSLASLASGAVLLAAAAAQGDVRFFLLVVLPVLVAEGPLAAGGVALLIASGLLWLASRARPGAPARPEEEPAAPPDPGERRTRSGGVILIGPIPIVWGSDRRVLPWMVGAGVVLLLLGLLVALALTRPR